MHIKVLKLFPLLLLTGCVSPINEPYSVEATDPVTYKADLTICAKYALAYHKPLSLSGLSTAAVKGGASNASGAAVNALVPVLGAVGGLSTELLNELDLMDNLQRDVFLKCVEKKTDRDQSALVLEPRGL